MTDRKPIHTLGSRYLWRSQWYNLRQDEIRLPDGSQTTYTTIEMPGAVWVVPVTADGRVALIYNYRYTVDAWCWEVPAGSILPGLTPEQAARRELREEVGGEAEHLQEIARFYTMNGIGNEEGHAFLATGVRLGVPQREPTEIMEVHLVAADEALNMARRGQISAGPSALSLLLCADSLTQPI